MKIEAKSAVAPLTQLKWFCRERFLSEHLVTARTSTRIGLVGETIWMKLARPGQQEVVELNGTFHPIILEKEQEGGKPTIESMYKRARVAKAKRVY
jgi:hypothetical protein